MKNIKEIIALICCCNLVFPVPMAIAAPQGGKVVGGSAHIHQSGATTTINQSSNRAVINWNSFDIGKNETVRHNMPSANSAGLHRVVGGGGASQIMGQLQSNGNVYLVNPAGVVIHKGARIDANSFTATSRDISNDNFMKGTMVFDKPGRPDAEVINQGTISVKENGLAALVAPTVRNDGVIAGKLAKVALASGDSTWKLDMHGDDLITFTVDEKDVDTLHAVDGTPLAGVENSGSIKAEGGVVVLTAAQLDGIVGSVVNSGEVSAASAELKGGKIVFKGAGSGVDIVNTGTVDASSAVADGGSVRMDTDGKVRSSGLIAATGGQKGGKVVVTGKDVALTGKAKIDVSGNKGGGTALVGGNALGKGPERNARTTKVEKGTTIVADARTKGDGGQVVVWSDEKTNFDGTITARGGSDGGNGGKVETSGKHLKVADTARVDTRASKGIHGQWLLDPMDFVIAASDGDMTGEALSANLETGNVRIESANGVRDGHGDIFVNSSVSWDADNTLSLDAERNIYINADITATGDHAGLNLLPAGDYMLGDAKITLSGADPRLSIKGESYVVIHDVNELKNINRITAFDNNYALGVDIDASSAEDFTGIGLDTGFSGIFDGMGHTIESLRIKDDYDIFEQGFFTAINSNGIVRNLVLSNVSVLGGHLWAGAIAGSSDGYIHHVSVTGQVEGDMSAGGIVGVNRGVIEQAFSSADVSCTIGGGGVVGENTAGATISYSGSSGSICGDGVGGFAGSNKGKISFSYSSGIVEEAAINSGNSNGGFVGMNSGIIANSYSLSDIRADSGNRAWGTGGFAGELLGGTLDRVYWSGTISSKDGKPIGSHVGAIVGYISKRWNEDIVNISASYGLDSGCPPDQSGVEYENVHGIGKLELASGEYYIYSGLLTTEQMKSQTSFQGWDFENIWAIDEGQSSPYLRPVAITVPGPSPDPDPDPTPTPDPDPTPTPDPEPGVDVEINPNPDSSTQSPGVSNVSSEESYIEKNLGVSDKNIYYESTHYVTPESFSVEYISEQLSPSIEGIKSHIDIYTEHLPELMQNAILKYTLTKGSASIILSTAKFLAGGITTLLKEVSSLVGNVLNYELFDMLMRMHWASESLRQAQDHIDQAKYYCDNNYDINTSIKALEHMKKARECEIQALILCNDYLDYAESNADRNFLEKIAENTWNVAKELGVQTFDFAVGFFVGPEVNTAVTEYSDEITGILAQAFVEHGRSFAELENYMMTDFQTPETIKNVAQGDPIIQHYSKLIDSFKALGYMASR